MQVKDLMRTNVVTVFQEETCQRAAELMAEKETGTVLVTATNGRLAGIISDRDIVTQCVAKCIDPAETKVRDLCKYDPITITANADVGYAINRMLIGGVHRLPVVEQENIIVGMLSLDDIAADVQRYVGDFAQIVGEHSKR